MSERGAAGREAATGAAGGRAVSILRVLVVFALAFGLHLWLEFRDPGLHGTDGYFHVKVARLLASGELSPLGGAFPWMAYGTYGRLGADWQLGYHLLLIPFVLAGGLVGAKVSAAVFAALVPAVLYALLRAHRVPFASVFALLACLTSENHLARAHLVRPTTLLVVLLLVVAHLAATRRAGALFAAALALLAVYDVPHNVLAVLGLTAVAVLALEGRVPWKVLLSGGAAVVLAIALHPGFWHWEGPFLGPDHGLFRIWSQMSGALRASVDGNQILFQGHPIPYPAPGEFRAPTGRLILDDFLAPVILTAGTLVLLALPARRRLTPFVLVTTGLAGLYFLMFLGHQRFFEYWIPFAVLAAGAAFGRAVGERPREVLAAWRARPPLQALAWAVLALAPAAAALGYGGAGLARASRTLASGTGGGEQYEGSMRWLRENTEEGELVFHGQWPQFSPMFYFNHWNRYVIGLDPYFFYQDDPENYLLWYRAGAGDLDPAQTVAVIQRLGARWAFARRTSDLAERLLRSPAATLAFEDGRWVVFRVAAG